MGEEMKQGVEKNRRGCERDERGTVCCDPCDSCDPCDPCDCCDPCEPVCGSESGWDWESWIPLLVVIFLLCGGFSLFGGGKDDCCDDGPFGGLFDNPISWLLILLVIWLIFGNSEGKRGGGFFGGLF